MSPGSDPDRSRVGVRGVRSGGGDGRRDPSPRPSRLRSAVVRQARRVVETVLPHSLRVELVRLRRLPSWWLEHGKMAKRQVPERDRGAFQHTLAAHASPLRRPGTPTDPRLQRGKERNVARVAERLDGLCIEPCQVFSFYHRVGRPGRWRGYRPGLELHAGQLASGVGGGLCQVANLVFLLALRAGMRIVERHRHGLDLFPDDRRTVPFGCGATVFYNLADLRFQNPLRRPLLLELRLEGGWLCGRLLTDEPVAYRVEIYEVDHRFRRLDGQTWRENRIRRRFVHSDGATLLDHEVCHNLARVVYPVERIDPTAKGVR